MESNTDLGVAAHTALDSDGTSAATRHEIARGSHPSTSWSIDYSVLEDPALAFICEGCE